MVLNVFVLCSCRCSTKSTLARYPFGDCVCLCVVWVWVWVWVWVCDLSLSLPPSPSLSLSLSVCLSVSLSLSLSHSLSLSLCLLFERILEVQVCVRACMSVLCSMATPTSVSMRKYVHHTFTHLHV